MPQLHIRLGRVPRVVNIGRFFGGGGDSTLEHREMRVERATHAPLAPKRGPSAKGGGGKQSANVSGRLTDAKRPCFADSREHKRPPSNPSVPAASNNTGPFSYNLNRPPGNKTRIMKLDRPVIPHGRAVSCILYPVEQDETFLILTILL